MRPTNSSFCLVNPRRRGLPSEVEVEVEGAAAFLGAATTFLVATLAAGAAFFTGAAFAGVLAGAGAAEGFRLGKLGKENLG